MGCASIVEVLIHADGFPNSSSPRRWAKAYRIANFSVGGLGLIVPARLECPLRTNHSQGDCRWQQSARGASYTRRVRVIGLARSSTAGPVTLRFQREVKDWQCDDSIDALPVLRQGSNEAGFVKKSEATPLQRTGGTGPVGPRREYEAKCRWPRRPHKPVSARCTVLEFPELPKFPRSLD